MANVHFEGVTKRFGDVAAVNNLTLEVADKEFLVLVGPSGCGKTTALRVLAGLEETTEGTVSIGSRVVNDVPPKDRDIAMVFQSYALYPHMSVYDNMAFGLKLRKIPKDQIKERVGRAAKTLGIEMLLDRKPKQLSGCQRQRVAVGRAIVREPSVFLFDEPLSNLDAKLRVQTRAEISKLHQQLQTTFIYVTHDQVEAMTMATRIAVMKDGVLQQCDTPQAVYSTPANIFVAGFIGSPSMNFFEGTVEESDGKLMLNSKAFRIPIPENKRKACGAYTGKPVTLGIRPEDIHDALFVPPDVQSATISAKVDITEMMGNEIYVYLMSGGSSFVARLDPRTGARGGGDVKLAVNIANLHLFDRTTELAIT